jgi:hypothetical protein
MQNTIAQPVFAQLLNASATSLSTTVAKNIPVAAAVGTGGGNWPQITANTVFLNPGWWMMNWSINFILAAVSATIFSGGLSATTGTAPTVDAGLVSTVFTTTTLTGNQTLQGSFLYNVAANGTQLFLVALCTFSAGTLTASGYVSGYQVQQ